MRTFSNLRFIIAFTVCTLPFASAAAQNTLVPQPLFVQIDAAIYKTKAQSFTYFTNMKGREKREFAEAVQSSLFPMKSAKSAQADVRFCIDNIDPQLTSDEAYRIEVTNKGIDVSASAPKGLFYALQTLAQLRNPDGSIPHARIFDQPRFSWRGWHMDCSRHFFTTDFIKRMLKQVAHYKINTFHWHLTDDPGWRIEIKRYPELTRQTAYRFGKTWDDWCNTGQRFCRIKEHAAHEGVSGGYYTQKEIKEIVEYARRLGITVVPEIEMPGHSWEVLAAKPELACSGKPYENGELCIGNEATFEFLEGVLTEVMNLFPSEYIHIGGDEANRSHWAKCPKCQKRMTDEGLKTVEELQSYLTRRIEKFLSEHRRKLLGWDEIIEGGLSRGATVMSWRGEQGGIHAARTGHDAVMTPWQCYLDNAQDDPTVEPRGVGGYVPLQSTYSYEPIPAELTVGEAKHILGVQGNVWAEHISTPSHAEYMIFPRILAIAENGWTDPARKNWERFRGAAIKETERLRAAGFNTFDLTKERGNRKEFLTPLNHKAKGKSVEYVTPWSPKYKAAGGATLTDGLRGSFTYQDGRWQGFENDDFDIIVNLDSITDVRHIGICFMQRADQWIWLPKEVVISISNDAKEWRELSRVSYPEITINNPDIIYKDYSWQGTDKAHYVRIKAAQCGHPGSWLFTDEVIVE